MPGGGDVYLDWLDISGGTFYFWLKRVCNIFYYTIPKLWANFPPSYVDLILLVGQYVFLISFLG
jgi:hypothetical protein